MSGSNDSDDTAKKVAPGAPVSLGQLTALPADPDILRGLKEELASAMPSPDRVSRAVLQDPAIAIAIAQNTYSVQQGLSDPFSLTNVWQMISRLGVDRVRVTLEVLGSRPLPPTTLREAMTEQRMRAVRIAKFTRIIIKYVNPGFSDTAELIGLLGSIGNMLAVLILRDRFVALLEETPNHAKANYRLLKEFNFNGERTTAEFLRLNGIPDKFIGLMEREGAAPSSQNLAELKTAFLAAGELSNAFDENKQAQYAPGKTLPVMSSLRLLQIKDPAYVKLHAELLDCIKAEAANLPPGEVLVVLNDASPSVDPTAAPGLQVASTEEPTEDDLEESLAAEVEELPAGLIPTPTPQADLEVLPVRGFLPSAERISRIQRLRVTASQNPKSDNAEISSELTPDLAFETAEAAVSAVVRENLMIERCIRGIRSAENLYGKGHLGGVRDLAVSYVQPITDRIPRYQAALYFATKAYYPHLLDGKDKVNLNDAIGMLLPAEISSIVALTYLSHQVFPRCDESECNQLIRQMRIHLEIGRLVGGTVPDMNGGLGMLIAGARFLGLAIILAQEGKKYTDYRIQMKSSKRLWDITLEQERFGTTHLELGAIMLQRLGFGVQIAGEILPVTVMTGETTIPRALRWMDSIHTTGSPFTAREMAPLLGVQRPELITLRDKVQAVFNAAEPCRWFMSEKADLLIDGRCKVPTRR